MTHLQSAGATHERITQTNAIDIHSIARRALEERSLTVVRPWIVE